MGELVEAADEVESFLKTEFRRGPAPDAAQVGKLIADLDSVKFAVREQATVELTRLGRRVLPAMQKALREKPSPEMGRRLEELVGKLSSPVADLAVVRFLRAVEVLERRGTGSSRQILSALAKREPEDLICSEARASLDRLQGQTIGR
jgi:hypothetical protein